MLDLSICNHPKMGFNGRPVSCKLSAEIWVNVRSLGVFGVCKFCRKEYDASVYVDKISRNEAEVMQVMDE